MTVWKRRIRLMAVFALVTFGYLLGWVAVSSASKGDLKRGALLFAAGIVFLVGAWDVGRRAPTNLGGEAGGSGYTAAITKIEVLAAELSALGKFLEQERSRVEAAEEVMRHLKKEKAHLEPIVQTQREVVDAILTANAERTARNAWKQGLLGFFLGIVASLIASSIVEYMKR